VSYINYRCKACSSKSKKQCDEFGICNHKPKRLKDRIEWLLMKLK
jgi:hypothetical protein